MDEHLLVLPIVLPFMGAILAAALRGKSGAWVALFASGATLSAATMVLSTTLVDGPQVYRVGGWEPPYGVVLVADLFSAVLAVTSAVVAVASSLHMALAGRDVAQRQFYHPLFLFLLTALGGVFLTGDLFNLYVFMEMVILSSFALVAMADRPVSAETTFKYAVLSALGSLFLLTGVALVYAGVGTLNMADIARRVRQEHAIPFWPAAAAMTAAAFFLKGAIFPFHFWQPDAHAAAPSAVSAMLSGVLVKIGFYGVARLATLIFPGAPVFDALAPIGAASALFGGLAALSNANLKRMLAYSTIANMGFILLALGWGGPLGVTAAIVAAIHHALVKASLFLSGGFVTEQLHEQQMPRLSGVAGVTTAGAVAFGLGAMALAGLPPLSGFLSKLTLFQAGLAAQDLPLLAVAALASALGLVNSVRAFTGVFWGATPDWVRAQWSLPSVPPGAFVAPLVLVFLSLVVGGWPGPFMALAVATAHDLQQPEIYISAVLGNER